MPCAVLFQKKCGDEIFSRESQKRLKMYVAGHNNPAGEQPADIEAFLAARLTA